MFEDGENVLVLVVVVLVLVVVVFMRAEEDEEHAMCRGQVVILIFLACGVRVLCGVFCVSRLTLLDRHSDFFIFSSLSTSTESLFKILAGKNFRDTDSLNFFQRVDSTVLFSDHFVYCRVASFT